MAISQAMWIHGHGLQSENPTFAVGRVGWGGQIKQLGSQGWYHLAIPTPVIVTDIRLRLDAAVIQFSGGSQGLIQGVHVYDGNNQIARQDNLTLHGVDQIFRIALPNLPPVQWGVGISMLIALGADPANAWLEIHSCGADFV
jgi:hypothetical protein